jgi:hypothetical protein
LRRAEDRLYSVPHKHFLPNHGKKRGETGLNRAGSFSDSKLSILFYLLKSGDGIYCPENRENQDRREFL